MVLGIVMVTSLLLLQLSFVVVLLVMVSLLILVTDWTLTTVMHPLGVVLSAELPQEKVPLIWVVSMLQLQQQMADIMVVELMQNVVSLLSYLLLIVVKTLPLVV